MPSEVCSFLLNDVFVGSFSCTVTSDCPVFRTYDFLPMFPVIVNCEGVSNIIENLKTNTTAGIDNINAKFLKNTNTYSSVILSKLFSQSLEKENCQKIGRWGR